MSICSVSSPNGWLRMGVGSGWVELGFGLGMGWGNPQLQQAFQVMTPYHNQPFKMQMDWKNMNNDEEGVITSGERSETKVRAQTTRK